MVRMYSLSITPGGHPVAKYRGDYADAVAAKVLDSAIKKIKKLPAPPKTDLQILLAKARAKRKFNGCFTQVNPLDRSTDGTTAINGAVKKNKKPKTRKTRKANNRKS